MFINLSAIFNSSCPFYCRAIFIAAVHFVAVQPDSNYHGFSFKAGPFFYWIAVFALSCRHHIHLAAKDRCDYRSPPNFFCFSGCYSSRHFHSRRHFLIAVPIVTIQPIAIHILWFFPSLHPTFQHCSLSLYKDVNMPTNLLSLCTVRGKYGGCAVTAC